MYLKVRNSVHLFTCLRAVGPLVKAKGKVLATRHTSIRGAPTAITNVGYLPVLFTGHTTYSNRVLAIKIIRPIIPSNLKRARFILASLLTGMSESPKFHRITKKYKNLVSEKGKIGWHRKAQHIFLQHGV